MIEVDQATRLDHFFQDVVSGLPPAKFYTIQQGSEQSEIRNEGLNAVQFDRGCTLVAAYWYANPRRALICPNDCIAVPHSIRLKIDLESRGLRLHKQDGDRHLVMSLQYEILGLTGVMNPPDGFTALSVPNGAMAALVLAPWINAMYGQ
jgi:hypothetical protein